MRATLSRLCPALAAVVLLGFGTSPVTADPPSWSSFEVADVTGIYLAPLPATDVLIYSLSLGTNPTITICGNTYDVNWVQAYFLVSQDESTPIDAANADIVEDWTWELKGIPGAIAGWRGKANARLERGQSKILGYEVLNIGNNAVLSGMHIGYQTDPSTEVTGWYKTDLQSSVPEPSSIIALGVALVGFIPIARRRMHRS